jgi:hypothetical protein
MRNKIFSLSLDNEGQNWKGEFTFDEVVVMVCRMCYIAYEVADQIAIANIDQVVNLSDSVNVKRVR